MKSLHYSDFLVAVWHMFLNTMYYMAFKRDYTVYLDKFAPEFLDLQTQEHSITIFIFLELFFRQG